MARRRPGAAGDGFGTAIASAEFGSRRYVAIGVPGAAGGGRVDVFELDAGNDWTLHSSLAFSDSGLPPEPDSEPAPDPRFGAAVDLEALDGVLRIVIGYPGYSERRGGMVVFEMNNTTEAWTRFVSPDPFRDPANTSLLSLDLNDIHFGSVVTALGNLIAVGVVSDDPDGDGERRPGTVRLYQVTIAPVAADPE